MRCNCLENGVVAVVDQVSVFSIFMGSLETSSGRFEANATSAKP